MSNPCVFTLSDHKLNDCGLRVRIEDNVGEAIHFHFGDIRVDLTVNEFMDIADRVVEACDSLMEIENFSINNIDPIFLSSIASKLPDLERVVIEEIPIGELKIVSRKYHIPVVRSLEHSRVYRALNGDPKEQINYKQENMKNQSNLDRIDLVKKSLGEHPYPYNNQYIILFNNQNFIRDGQHRAACLYNIDPDMIIPVMRFYFKNNKYNASNHPWAEHFFKWDRRRIVNLLRYMRRKKKKIIHQIRRKASMLRSKTKMRLWRVG